MKSIATTIFVLVLFAMNASAAELGGNKFLKISAYDQKAVIKTASGEMKTVGVGDQIEPNRTIVEIAENQVVIAVAGGDGQEKLIVSLDENGNQKIDRMGAALTKTNKQ